MIKKISFLFLIFILSLQVIIDPDFGWHLRVGEFIFNNYEVPKHDILSYTLPNFPYVYHSWTAEVLTFIFYKTFGVVGISIFFAIILTISIAFLIKISKIYSKNEIVIPFIFLATIFTRSIAGGKMRIFQLLFFTIIYYLYSKYEIQKSKQIYLVPIIFFLWANFHASFMFGLFTLAFLFLISKNKSKKLTIIFVLSALATLINPYFINAWKQAILMPINSMLYLSTLNPDWRSMLITKEGLVIALLFAIFLPGIFFYKNKISKSQKILILTFVALSIISSRFIVLLIVFIVPVGNLLIINIKQRLNKTILYSVPIRLSVYLVCLLLGLISLLSILEIVQVSGSLENYSKYMNSKTQDILHYQIWPYEVNLLISQNHNKKRLLSDANGAGYLSLQNANTKLFYYSAMDNFFLNNQSFAFEYNNLIHTQNNWEQKLNQYNIELIALPSEFDLIKKLKTNSNWQVVYNEQNYSILEKNNIN